MIRFWLVTVPIDPSRPGLTPGPILAARTTRLAVEVLHEGQSWAVLFSAADDLDAPGQLTCLIGFTNAAALGNLWHARGFPLVDAAIDVDAKGTLTVMSPSFRDASSMKYEEPLVSLSGLGFGTTMAGTAAGLTTTYVQELRTPDLAQPDVWITRRTARWILDRSDVLRHDAANIQIGLNLGSPAARSPGFAPLETGPVVVQQAWSGTLNLPIVFAPPSGPPLEPLPTADIHGIPAFSFDDVEVLGFRIDLGATGRKLDQEFAELLEPLNFHLSEGEPPPAGFPLPDFRYCAATNTVLIELLRYGRMTANSPPAPLEPDDSQSQHELLVRLLVGRVDDDTGQAHSPAAYVPAIFVDNPWSKILGRFALGFDKRLADFYVRRNGGHARLLPDGRLAVQGTASYTADPVPLGDIARVDLVDTTGRGSGSRLLDFEFQSPNHTDPDAFHWVDRIFGFGTPLLTGGRWRESDFDLPAFARAFTRRAIPESFRSFRCVQVAPLTGRILTQSLEQTWIEGTFVIDDVRFALPLGTATLRFHAVAPESQNTPTGSTLKAWNLLCQVLGDGTTAEITLRTGSWYRLLCSMNLTIDDRLRWG